jgi:vacuolar protein sorting-associated protein 53
VTPQLESMIQNKILKDLVDSVSFDSEVEAFMDVLAHALNCLQFGLLDKLENGFRTMQSFNWGAVTVVGEESGYLYQWQKILQDIVPSIRDALSETYFRTFCTKFATHFLSKYLDIIVKQKKISEIGTQQLLLDTYNIKTLLLHFHHMGQANPSAPSSSSSTGPSLLPLLSSSSPS